MISLNSEQARRFHVHSLGLDVPCDTVAEALDHLGFVQIDPINVCGRMHDLILRNRVNGYREGQLLDELHGKRRLGFEHYMPGRRVLVAFPMATWPYLAALLKAGRPVAWPGAEKMNSRERKLADRILEEVEERGPLSCDDVEHEGKVVGAWGVRSREVRVVMEKLFFRGRLLISSRRKFRRVYDLPERVIPAKTWRHPLPSPQEADRWFACLRMRQQRLGSLKRSEATLVGDAVEAVEIAGYARQVYCLRSDLELLEKSRRRQPSADCRLLAPLDPLIYDRKLTAHVWNFEYTWEVYTPPAKRVRGYYALPLLRHDELVGHIDPKVDRKARKLQVMGRRIARGNPYASALREFRKFLGVNGR